jgi:addiction module HigA family antidote
MSVARKGTPNWKVHPGEILKEEFLKPMGLSVYRLAKEIRVPAPRVNDIVLRKRGITADTAVRLAKFFGTSEQFWLGLQAAYEVNLIKSEHRSEINQIKPLATRDRGNRGAQIGKSTGHFVTLSRQFK